ncbi:MAG TPA: hypothetical protein VGQ83_03510 [Polyangia bacterium]|jgi:hypothetical protein
MSRPGPADLERAAYLVVDGAPAWAVPAAAVARVVDERTWDGPAPLDPATTLELGARGEGASRLIIVRGPAGEVALRARGSIAPASISPSRVSPVPPEAAGRHGWAFAGVVLDEDRAGLLILRVDALTRPHTPTCGGERLERST